MSGRTPRKASDQIPYCADQGTSYLMGATQSGVSTSYHHLTMVAGGVFKLGAKNMPNMADTDYTVFITNETGTNAGKVAKTAKQTTQFTITGPSTGDELGVLIIGRVAGQVKGT